MQSKTIGRRNSSLELLGHFASVLSERLKKEGFKSSDAERISVTVMDEIKFEFGGQILYMPKGTWLGIEERDAQIYASWKVGTDVSSLAANHNISSAHVYRIIARMRAADRVSRGSAITNGDVAGKPSPAPRDA